MPQHIQYKIINNDLFLIFAENHMYDLFLDKARSYMKSNLDLNLVVDISALSKINILLITAIIESYILRRKNNKKTIIYASEEVHKFLHLIHIPQFIDVLIKAS